MSDKEADRVLLPGRADLERCDNKVVSARYTAFSFLPVAIVEQFRRFANMYFLIIGSIMAAGYFGENTFESAISPFTTLGPLAFVISVSLLVEGNADYKRHLNDAETNNATCVILQRAEEIDAALLDNKNADGNGQRCETVMKGRDVRVNINKAYYTDPATSSHGDSVASSTIPANVNVGFQNVRRMDIRQGHFVLVRNREMVPADMVLLASSNDQGSAYIETSSIDGETNLKLRMSPNLPKDVLEDLRGSKKKMESINEEREAEQDSEEDDEAEGDVKELETIEAATRRITRFSALGRPHGKNVLEHPDYEGARPDQSRPSRDRGKIFGQNLLGAVKDAFDTPSSQFDFADQKDDGKYVAALTTEPPNPSVHTFSGKLTLPPFEIGSIPQDIPLGADNVLLRGAVIRNTEWVIGIAFFTGTDTKLIQNSFETPSKFSQLDQLMNKTVLAILCIMLLCITYLASMAVYTTDDEFDDLWYAGFNKDTQEPWPYLPTELELGPPEWKSSSNTWIQYFFMYITLLSNFVPLSLYVTIEFITFCMLWLIYSDKDMYCDVTNTRAVARSTIVTDLGRIQYIFSDKTGTLTQNVMRFKRCSVDGMAFGAPIAKSRPGQEEEDQLPFLPLRKLLLGRFKSPSAAGLEGLGETDDPKLTFNAEMFLRVMSLCHTVVVEKDLDKKESIDSSMSVTSTSSKGSLMKSLFGRKRANTGDSVSSPLSAVDEDHAMVETSSHGGGANRSRLGTASSFAPGQELPSMGPDGAPYGYAYQAESPDEGALVSAASHTYGFQVISRDSSGIRMKTCAPSHLQESRVTDGLKNKTLSTRRLAAESASAIDQDEAAKSTHGGPEPAELGEEREEVWSILAVNKFDSDRKRMSILLRSPPELGSIPILFCKGADSAMLDSTVCANAQAVPSAMDEVAIPRPGAIGHQDRDVSTLSAVSEDNGGVDEEGWEIAQMLGIQAHLGDFASEGLRTLVLGMRVLSEDECTNWLKMYQEASTSMKDRDEMLTAAAKAIETEIHIVGATAIEDKLQVNVPNTIATLGKAGIKLWVLTGDKRETAIEIGYSTKVLTPKMHVTEVPDEGLDKVRTKMAMEFIRLVKKGRLPDHQMAAVNDVGGPKTWRARFGLIQYSMAKCMRAFGRTMLAFRIMFLSLIGARKRAGKLQHILEERREAEEYMLRDTVRRAQVRQRADETIQKWLASADGKKEAQRRKSSPIKTPREDDSDSHSMATEETPAVFNRASSARGLLNDMRASGSTTLSQKELREITLAHHTAQSIDGNSIPLVDEDCLSLESFFPGQTDDLGGNFDGKKRTLLERAFAVDRHVRKGRLRKHVKKEKLASIAEQAPQSARLTSEHAETGPRALVIEGASLKHLLGDHEMEEILFSVASQCEAVIACRVSPKQKALLVNLVRHNVKPEPITLAIGDGANDVGMIQEAHVGIGISGKEGKQAVNASDFAIAQFRFLEDLILVHGRWNFFRMATVILFSFYKNAILAGMLIVFTSRSVYSGTPLFDDWLIAILNFVAGIPIIILGLFDRCLSKEYVKSHPEVYTPARENELITPRILVRWVILVFIHIFCLYYFTVPQQSYGGGITSAFSGQMRNDGRDAPGDGEGGDLKSVGTVTFTCMVFLLAYKVIFESRSLVHGRWPAFMGCRKGSKEPFLSRIAYTWQGITWGSIGFYMIGISFYMVIGRYKINSFSRFVDTPKHVFGMRSLSWMLILFVPMIATTIDVIGKVFSNMFYPTQTQIHLERESRAKMRRRARDRIRERPIETA